MQGDRHFSENVYAVYGEVDQVSLHKKVNSVHTVEKVVNHPELPFTAV